MDIRITYDDFKKLVKLLEKEGCGAHMSFKTNNGSSLLITTLDRSGKEMQIEISDVNYPMMPRLTKTETF